jgi:Recombinase
VVPAGYECERSIDDDVRVTRRLIKHRQTKHMYELLWQLSANGASVQKLALQLNRRGFRTTPVRKDHKSHAFDTSHIGMVFDNPYYAGLVTWNGERLPVTGRRRERSWWGQRRRAAMGGSRQSDGRRTG